MEQRVFLKELTPAEAGETKTHESYIRLPNNFDYEDFFQQKGEEVGSVIQVNFVAFMQENENDLCPIKFVYYFNNTNQEKRIPSLRQIYERYGVTSGYIVRLCSETENGKTQIKLSFLKPSEAKLVSASPILYYISIQNQDDASISKYNETSLQQIFYGAPGTGKSFCIKRQTRGEAVVRTTFHPDTDYATFVGAYKPTIVTEPRYTAYGEKAVVIKDSDGHAIMEDKIVYEFVPQAFLQAYVEAWRKMSEAEPKGQYLVIEEINRGNCAQIFGDLFQLLDRGKHGFSEYPIKADKDMQRYLGKAFEHLQLADAEGLNALFDGEDIADKVKRGEVLLLPSNLHIWATMNTSDQSLFPIDSAFKRRWDWQYMPISDAKKGWQIAVGEKRYDWWQFLTAINKEIDNTTHSEDKQLGYFFCKPSDGIISAETFVGKVLFYLWNDVFKDYEFDNPIFNDSDDGEKLAFRKFYTEDAEGVKVAKDKVQQFLKNLEANAKGIKIEVEEEKQSIDETKSTDGEEL